MRLLWVALMVPLAACKPAASRVTGVVTRVPPPDMAVLAKGVGDFSGQAARIDGLQVSWYYNWTPRPTPGVSAEFVPMIWGERDINEGAFASIKSGSSKALLAFNEPDQTSADQSGMSVARAAEVWTNKLVGLGKRLGTPATVNYANGEWFEQFMGAIDQSTVGFIALHHYASDVTNLTAAVEEYRTLLDQVYRKYHKPIWLTEFGGPAYTTQPTSEQEVAFLEAVVAMMQSLGYVERYAWYSTSQNKDSATYGACLLFDAGATLTSVGLAYKQLSAAKAAGVTTNRSQTPQSQSSSQQTQEPTVYGDDREVSSSNAADESSTGNGAGTPTDPWAALGAGIVKIVKDSMDAAKSGR